MLTEGECSLWEFVIGLEVHVELNTNTKLFCSSMNKFGCEPNTNISPTSTGQPGSLPVLNKEALKKAILFGCAVNGDISDVVAFDRKSYFYPDNPRNFQITQFRHPIIRNGELTTFVGDVKKSFQISYAHIEDDTGVLKHFSKFTGVDFNRAGVPLVEIVFAPCMFSVEDAVNCAESLRLLLSYLDISDCNMEEGSFRMDVNVSVRKKGASEMRPKVEIKNMNSFSCMKLALESEFKRQVSLYEANEGVEYTKIIPQETFRWDPETNTAVKMRKKESAAEYRYCPEPDLTPFRLPKKFIEDIAKELPELPEARRERYNTSLQISKESIDILVKTKALSNYFEEAAKGAKNIKILVNWILSEFMGRAKVVHKAIWELGINPENIAQLANLIEDKVITGKIAKDIADLMVEQPEKSPKAILEMRPDLLPLDDSVDLIAIIKEVVQSNPQSVADFKLGKERAFGFLVGQVMKQTKGKADPSFINKELKNLLA